MDEKRRVRRDFLQNILITLLLLSAVLLFVGLQHSTTGSGSGFFDMFSESATQPNQSLSTQTPTASFPVRIAVTGTYGRYGSVTMTTQDASFEVLIRLLGNTLNTARGFTICDDQAFLSALRDTSVYFDFLSPLPLSLLAEISGTSSDEPVAARHVVIAATSEGVQLYLWDDANHYMVSPTALPVQDLEQTVGLYELGNAQFALDLIASNPHARSIAPCSLFLTETPVLPSFASSIPSVDSSRLLTALEFNPNTKFRYTESTGTEVIEENSRTLRIHTDGSIHYQNGTETDLSINATAEQPTVWEAVSGASALLNNLLGTSTGEAFLYLNGIQQTDSTYTLTFGYHVNGIPIRFASGQDAATVTLSGTTVTDLTLRIRQYTADSSSSLLLPLQQTLSVARRHPGTELSIGYVDNGSGVTQANWLID